MGVLPRYVTTILKVIKMQCVLYHWKELEHTFTVIYLSSTLNINKVTWQFKVLGSRLIYLKFNLNVDKSI